MREWKTAPRRAWENTQNWIIGYKFWPYVIGAVFILGCAMLATFLTPIDASKITNCLYGLVGGIIALVLFIAIVYIIHLIIAPIKQRNEARNEVERLDKRIMELEQPNAAPLLIEVHSADLFQATHPFIGVNVDCTLRPNRDHLQLVDIKLCVGPGKYDSFSPSKLPEYLSSSSLQFPIWMENRASQRYTTIRFEVSGEVILRQHPANKIYTGHLHLITGEGELDSREFTIAEPPTSHKEGFQS